MIDVYTNYMRHENDIQFTIFPTIIFSKNHFVSWQFIIEWGFWNIVILEPKPVMLNDDEKIIKKTI
jgi:hypothetical protein